MFGDVGTRKRSLIASAFSKDVKKEGRRGAAEAVLQRRETQNQRMSEVAREPQAPEFHDQELKVSPHKHWAQFPYF